MTPKTKTSLLNLSAFIGAIVAVTGLTGSAKAWADRQYVRTDTFAVYQVLQQGKGTADSLKHDREIAEIRAALARVDSNTQCNRRRKPSWCD